MSDTSKSDLKPMDEFDLKAPFTVEILYESDDDKSPTNEIENNEIGQEKVLDDILSGIIEFLPKDSNQKNNATSKNRRLSSESSPSKRRRAATELSTTTVDESEIIQVPEIPMVDYTAINIQKDQGVSKEKQSSINKQTITLYASQSSNDMKSQQNDRQHAPFNQHQQQSQQIMTNTTWQDTINKTRLCPVNNNCTANPGQTSKSNNNGQTLNSCLNSQHSTNNYVHPLISLSQMIVSQNQVDMYTKASECIGTLLMSVSSHLVFIMKSWTEYIAVSKSTNRPLVEAAYKQYREKQYHYFYLSFTTVNHTLLPKENDPVFIKKFIDYTLDVGRSRNIYFTYYDMKLMLEELFAWVKSYRYPLLNELLRGCPQTQPNSQGQTNAQHQPNTRSQPNAQSLSNYRSNEQQSWHWDRSINTDNVGRFRTESPGRDSVINVNSTTVCTTQSVQNVYTLGQNLPQYEIIVQHKRPESQSIANSSSYNKEFQAFTRQKIESLLKGVTKNKRRPDQKINPSAVSIQKVHANIFVPPPSYESTISAQHNYTESQLINSANYDPFQSENQPCQVNRSLSRDSGIVSPISPACDLNYSSVVMTPMITHVTSLNPSATQIKDGVCIVCGTATKQMCLGCYKTYYCSNKCQVTDWTGHVGICKSVYT